MSLKLLTKKVNKAAGIKTLTLKEPYLQTTHPVFLSRLRSLLKLENTNLSEQWRQNNIKLHKGEGQP